MLKKLAQRIPLEARLESIPAPTGGWNTFNPIGAMPPGDAINMENFFPTPSDVMMRRGFSAHITALPDQVESLMAYTSPSGSELLFGAAGTAIYNCTAATATASTAVSGMANARWEHINFTNSGGTSYLLCVNGANGVRGFDGSSWSQLSISGTTASEFTNISQHKRRIWFTKDNTLQAWYLPVDAVAGTANVLDLSGIARRGGELMALGTWTLDAGNGLDDYWVAVTSEGEVVVYLGTDPSAATTWSLVGRWELGRPVGRRCFIKFAGDLLYFAEDGVWPLAQSLVTERTQPLALTQKISDSIHTASDNYRSNYGWQLLFWPRSTMLLLNIPYATGSAQRQYVMNTLTGAWCYFTGISANCFEIFQGNLYFGGNGVVSRFWNTFADNTAPITGSVKQAFHYFGSKALKQFTMARPIMQVDGTPSVSFGVNTDFDDSEVETPLSFSAVSAGTFDNATWDVSVFGGGLGVSKNWISVQGFGISAAMRIKVQAANTEVHWQATDILWKPGHVL